MPNSYKFFKPEIRQWFINNVPTKSRILDVGPGQGTYADLLEGLGYEIDAVEVYTPYIERFYLKAKYGVVYNENIMHFKYLGMYDFVILGDVLEHLNVYSAQHLLHDIEELGIGCMVAVPYMMAQDGEEYGNAHETHLQPDLSKENMLERYPSLELIYANDKYGYYKLKSKKHERAYVLYCTESYADTAQGCVNSIRAWSNIPIYVYVIGSSKVNIEGTNTIIWNEEEYNTTQEKFIDRKNKHVYNIMLKRPQVIIDCLEKYAKTVAYIDSDSVATRYVDRIFDLYPHNAPHPYFVRGVYDWVQLDGKGGVENREDMTRSLEHEACILFNVDQRVRHSYRQTGYFVAGQWSLDFLQEWRNMCVHPEVKAFPTKYAPYHEETLANVLLWKRKIKEELPNIYVNGSLNIIDEVYNEIGFNGKNNYVRPWFKIPEKESNLLFFHGEKNSIIMNKMISKLKERNKLKILFISPHLSTGGMPAFLLKRIEALKDTVEIFVVEYQCHSADYVVQRKQIMDILKSNFRTLWENKLELFDVINEWKPDVIHIDEMSERLDREIIISLYDQNRSYRIIETCHDVSFIPKDKIFHPDAYAFCTPYHLGTFRELPSKKYVLEFPIQDNLDAYDWQDAFMELGFNGSRPQVVNVGLWTPGKNQKEAVELAREMPDVDFHFVGNQAPNFKEYWEPIMSTLPSNCKIWGEMDDVWRFLIACDVFMFNSTWECNPLVIREAIGYRCKILARNLPQYVGMFDGYITPIGDNLKEQLLDLLDKEVGYDIPNQLNDFKSSHINMYETVVATDKKVQEVSIVHHFVNNPFLEIQGVSDSDFKIEFYDGNQLMYQNTIKANHWVKLNRQWYTKWTTKVWQDEKLIYNNTLSLENTRVYIAFDSSSLGDSIAWIPYCLEFKKKHNCHVIVSTFHNELFETVYPELEFVKPGSVVNNIYAQYNLGWFYDINKEPVTPNLIPLQKTATNILGLEWREIKPCISYIVKDRPTSEKYVTIATNSTAGCKFWTKKGWQEVINFLTSEGYNVINVSKERNPFDNCLQLEDVSIENTINTIHHSEFFIGLSSGLSWVSWAMNKQVVMIANFSEKDHEFSCIRITDESLCHGCWNKAEFKFDKGDWDWCPLHKDTPRHFECHRGISAERVIEELRILTQNL